jgi:hypothetical protein
MEGKKLTHATRLRRDQTIEIAAVQRLREDAIDLRARVSQGSYGAEEASRLWKLAESANLVLHIANPELAERAGLGSNFFTTLVRDKRRPKLQNFLRALTVMLEVADERLGGVDNDSAAVNSVVTNSRIQRDHSELLLLALSLSQIARTEIERLDAAPPNDPDTVVQYNRHRELLQIFAEGFDRIAKAVAAFAAKPNEPILLGKAADVVNSVGDQVTKWWKENGTDVADWAIRLPILTGGIAALGWAGADMVVGTTAIAALVGGDKVLKAIKSQGKSK